MFLGFFCWIFSSLLNFCLRLNFPTSPLCPHLAPGVSPIPWLSADTSPAQPLSQIPEDAQLLCTHMPGRPAGNLNTAASPKTGFLIPPDEFSSLDKRQLYAPSAEARNNSPRCPPLPGPHAFPPSRSCGLHLPPAASPAPPPPQGWTPNTLHHLLRGLH